MRTTIAWYAVLSLLLGRCTSQEPEPEPTHSSVATRIAELAEGAEVPPSRYAVPFEGIDEKVAWAEVDIPRGFHVWNESVLWTDDDPPSRGLLFWTVTGVNPHPCQGPVPPQFVEPGPTVEDLATALHEQPHRWGPAPIPVDLAGYDGLYLELRLPKGLDTDRCATGAYEAWQAIDPETFVKEERYQYGPGYVDRIWVLDVERHRLVVNATYDPRITRRDAATLDATLESITIHTGEAAAS